MKYAIFCVIILSCLIIGIKEKNCLMYIFGLIFNLYILLKNHYIKYILNMFFSEGRTSQFIFQIKKDSLIFLSGGSLIYYPCIQLEYQINSKSYQKQFSYDVRFFSPDIKDVENFFLSLKNIKFYYYDKYPKFIFIIKPLNKAMVREKYYLTILLIIQTVGLPIVMNL